MRKSWLLLFLAACGGTTPDDPKTTSDAGGPPKVDAGPPFFHLIEPTAAHLAHVAASPGGLRAFTAPYGASADGSVVVARSVVQDVSNDTSSQGDEAIRWTEAGGTVGLGVLPSCTTMPGFLPVAQPRAMSTDGSVVLGDCLGANETYLFRWTQASGLENVAPPPGFEGRWMELTPDGAVALGYATPPDGDLTRVPQAFRWTQATGAVALGTLPGADGSDAYGGMTSDGSVVIGLSGPDIFRWTEATGMVGLPKPPSYESCQPAHNQVSSDGTTVAGRCADANGYKPFRWKGTTAPQALELPAGTVLEDEPGVTADGAVIFGTTRRADETTRAFRWTESTGVVEFGPPDTPRCFVGSAWTLGRVASADASVMFGWCSAPPLANAAKRTGFRWTEGTGAVSLLPLPGEEGVRPDSISADGSTLVGQSLISTSDPSAPNGVAVVWDANGKATAIGDLLASAGMDLRGFKLEYAAVPRNAAGLVVGIAKNGAGEQRAWIARLP